MLQVTGISSRTWSPVLPRSGWSLQFVHLHLFSADFAHWYSPYSFFLTSLGRLCSPDRSSRCGRVRSGHFQEWSNSRARSIGLHARSEAAHRGHQQDGLNRAKLQPEAVRGDCEGSEHLYQEDWLQPRHCRLCAHLGLEWRQYAWAEPKRKCVIYSLTKLAASQQ